MKVIQHALPPGQTHTYCRVFNQAWRLVLLPLYALWELLPVELRWCSRRPLDLSFSWLLAPVYYVDLGFHHLQRSLVLFGWGIAKPLFCTVSHVQANEPPAE